MKMSNVLNDGNVIVEAKVNRVNGTPKSSILHRHIHHDPITVKAASGNYLELSDGRKVLDATGGAAVSCLGHGNQRVREAIARQMGEVSYCHSLFFGTTAGEALGKELINGTGGRMARAFIVSSGSEAMEAAMKLARQYFLELSPSQPARTNFIARKESYHGTTLGALSVGGHVTRRKIYEPMLLGNTSLVSACNAYRGQLKGESTEGYVARLAKELEDEFLRLGPETVCAFVAEPIVGAALGCVPAIPGYFKAMKGVCDKYSALLILDEVMSGMGRCGTLHAWEQEGIVPHIQTIGKGLGGGYAPVAGLLIGHRVLNTLDKGTGAFAHGQTYQGHPIACAAALEVQRIIREENLVENVSRMGTLMSSMLKQRLDAHPHVGNIRGKGLFWGIEFVRDKETKEPFDPSLGIAMRVHQKGIDPPYNISIYPGSGTVDGKSGDHVLISPAYNVTEADIRLIVDTTARVIEDFFAEF
ncbi:PLP-dependent transferase [Lindgomyces ingoldianus]|uniref:PLP-dependent transferase n=1 Tax=Lindgomyces ingoldianus TaxID=673940 RepID=A0ACB6QHA7_9PLEO|nr:PLP-dependent transferase [Lindgomyces ingoldianus]KAF2466378.1 PLP-dependent transferase [Lindgomyces ingoldianus]